MSNRPARDLLGETSESDRGRREEKARRRFTLKEKSDNCKGKGEGKIG